MIKDDEYWNAVCVPLTQGKHTIVDIEDYDRIRDHHLHYVATRNYRGNKKAGYAVLSITGKSITLHSFLFPLPSGSVPDHKNRNPLDNRKHNLRPATSAQNCWNRARGRSNRRSKYKGLWMDTRRGYWHVKIIANGVRHNLGAFKNEDDAAQAYNFLAHELHGEFAVFNRATALPESLK
jgi:hypothetical protein